MAASGKIHLTTIVVRNRRHVSVTLCDILARTLPKHEIAIEPGDVTCETCDKVAWGEPGPNTWPKDD
jgi:hypothetical protein